MNYGDLLFPLLARHALGGDFTITAVSPTSLRPQWPECMSVISIDDYGDIDADGVLIGGGNIIHCKKDRLPAYQQSGLPERAYRSLWSDAAAFANARRIPVAWNAPGVPVPFAADELEALIAPVVSDANYLSVREQASRDHLGSYGHRFDIVPDTALAVSEMWPRDTLVETLADTLTAAGLDPKTRYAVIHAKRRSMEGDASMMAAQIDDFARTSGLLPVLLPLGLCHADDQIARDISGAMQERHLCLDAPIGLRQITALIAFSEVFVGASLHGFIASASYGRRGVLVAKPRLPKFMGMADHLARPCDVVETWRAGFNRALSALREDAPQAPGEAMQAVHAHWTRVRRLFDGGSPV
nr:polysaccharide pyruvyl transferase family protein [Brevundimonas sp. Leaf363]